MERTKGAILIILVLIASVTCDDENDSSYWRQLGKDALNAAIAREINDGIVKNVIFFLGDGMGPSTVTAMRIYKQDKDNSNEGLAFDKFPYVSLVKTYSLDKYVPDSASTATAFFCGVKANYGTLGVNGQVKFDDCKSSLNPSAKVTSIMEWAQRNRKRTGFVTTKRVTDATPAALYSHSANRNWESKTPDQKCEDIAFQLINRSPGKNFNVIFGGGSSQFLPVNSRDGVGERTDGKDLIEQWVKNKKDFEEAAAYVDDYHKFTRTDPKDVDYVLGLFNATNLPYVLDRPDSNDTPTLAQMTKKAIEILDKGYMGYVLMVEGAQIDSGHHGNWAKKALEEGLDFDDAIRTALEMVNTSDTLVVVTADHSHPFVISGDFPRQKHNILGFGGRSNISGQPMTILSYGNGPGYKEADMNLKETQTRENNYRQDATYPMENDIHSGEDVAVYAIGPMAHLFHGVQEQSYLAHAIGYASCMGPSSYQYLRCIMRSSASGINTNLAYVVLVLIAALLLSKSYL